MTHQITTLVQETVASGPERIAKIHKKLKTVQKYV